MASRSTHSSVKFSFDRAGGDRSTNKDVILSLLPPPYARQGGEVITPQLSKGGISAKLQNVEWASGCPTSLVASTITT